MKNKIVIKLLLIFIVITLLFSIYNTSFVALGTDQTLGTPPPPGASTGKDLTPQGTPTTSGLIDTSATINNNNELIVIGGIIIGFIQWIAAAVSVLVTIVIGIRYILSSAEEKAEYKKTAIYYFIGTALGFSAINILSFAYDLLS